MVVSVRGAVVDASFEGQALPAINTALVVEWDRSEPLVLEVHSHIDPDCIAEALYSRIATGEIDRLDAVFSEWQPGHGIQVKRRRLFPFDMSAFPRPMDANAPLLNLTPEMLLSALTADYLHAQLCNAALHPFAAENEARMEAMAAARNQIERQLSALRATQRQIRQEEITAEIVELAAGDTCGCQDHTRSHPPAPRRAR